MNMILFRYVLKQFIFVFVATLFILTSVIMLFDAVELLRSAAKHESISFLSICLLAILKSPQMVHIILPFATLIAGLVFLFRMDKSSELVVMRAVGLSAWNIMLPVVLAVVCIGVFDMTVFNPISSITARKYERLEEQIGLTRSTPFVWSSQGFWLREVRPDRTLVIRASRVRQEDLSVMLDNVSVFELDNEGYFKKQNEAGVGILKNGVLTLQDAFVIDLSAETGRTISQVPFETDLSLDRILEKFDDPQTMSFWRFPHFIRFLKDAGFNASTHEMYWHEMIAYPATLVAMLLISAVFALPPSNRQGRALIRVLLAILSGFLLYFLTRITNVLGQAQSMPLILAAWGPALMVIPLCLSALLHLEDG